VRPAVSISRAIAPCGGNGFLDDPQFLEFRHLFGLDHGRYFAVLCDPCSELANQFACHPHDGVGALAGPGRNADEADLFVLDDPDDRAVFKSIPNMRL
jgi:hypothetical protein